MDLPKRKLIVKVKSSTAKEKFERRLAERKKTRKPTKPEILALEGLQYYSFVWPIGIVNKLCGGEKKDYWKNASTGEEIKANDYVLALIKKEIERKEAE